MRRFGGDVTRHCVSAGRIIRRKQRQCSHGRSHRCECSVQFASAEACGLHVHSLGSAAARAGGSATPFNRYGRRLFCAALCAGLGGGRADGGGGGSGGDGRGAAGGRQQSACDGLVQAVRPRTCMSGGRPAGPRAPMWRVVATLQDASPGGVLYAGRMEMKALKRRPRHTYTDDKMVNCDLAGIHAYTRAHAHSQAHKCRHARAHACAYSARTRAHTQTRRT